MVEVLIKLLGRLRAKEQKNHLQLGRRADTRKKLMTSPLSKTRALNFYCVQSAA